MVVEKFAGEVRSGHKEAAVEVPFDPGQRWGVTAQRFAPGRRGHRVAGQLNRVAFAESRVVARAGKSWLLLPDDLLQAAGATVGDQVDVELRPAGLP